MSLLMVIFALWMLAVTVGLMFVVGAHMLEHGSCTHDCNQGRNCTCTRPEEGAQRLNNEGKLEQYKEGSWQSIHQQAV